MSDESAEVKSEAAEKPEAKTEAKSAVTGANPVVEAMRGLAFASLALGAVMIGTAVITISHGLRSAALSPLAPGVLALLTAVLLFPAAANVENAESRDAERAILAGLFRDIARYSSLTLALCAISFLIVNFH